MCGEKQKRKLCLEDFLGSPPHVRGKVRRHRNDYLSVRITPACAGKSFLILDMNRFPKDHPRLCGEKGLWQCSQISIPGSPPHVRGKGEHKRKSTRGNRITPACAGKSLLQNVKQFYIQDHPRMCGEKIVWCWYANNGKGSPPHVRGKGRCVFQTLKHFGITPACAGKRH